MNSGIHPILEHYLFRIREMIKSLGIGDIEFQNHDLEMLLESILNASFPNPDDIDKIMRLLRKDLEENYRGLKSHLVEGKINFCCPISKLIGTKE